MAKVGNTNFAKLPSLKFSEQLYWRIFNQQPMMILTAIPLVIVFSLCYAATRYEDLSSIFRHALYFGGWLTFAMLLVAGMMEVIQLCIR